jgi:hypothetical protein
MGSVSDNLLGREVINAQGFHDIHVNTEFNRTFQVVLALHYIVNINRLHILPQHVQIPIGRCDIVDLSLLMPLISDVGHYFMPDEINHPNLVSLALENHKIVIIPVIVLAVDNKSSGKSSDSSVVLIFFRHSANHLDLFPCMNALRDVCLICGVLKVIDKNLLPVLIQYICVEKCYILRSHCCIDSQKSSIYFIHPITRTLSFVTKGSICDVRSQKPHV